MSGMLRRHYASGGVHHTVMLEDAHHVLRARIDAEEGDSAQAVDAHLIRSLTNGAEVWVSPGGRAVVVREGDRVHVAYRGRTYVLDVVSDRPGDAAPEASGDEENFVASPMTGVVLKLNVAAGDDVAAGAVVCVVEAMKMEFAIEAPRAVVIDEILCAAGDRVDIGDVLATFRQDD